MAAMITIVHAIAEAFPKSTISKLVLYKLTPTVTAEDSGPKPFFK